jgi:hypothetical protein
MRNLGLMDPAFLGGLGGLSLYDPDAAVYISAVEAADGQALETGVRDAINAFVLGCKTDGIWNAIKASCILAGARTPAGALVPLVGAAPTNFNFGSGDYDRKTGLKSDAISKRLSTSYSPAGLSAAGDVHWSAWLSELPSGNTNIMGCNAEHFMRRQSVGNTLAGAIRGGLQSATIATGFAGQSRAAGDVYSLRHNGSTVTATISPTVAATSALIGIFNRGVISVAPTDARLAFYSIGESLDLALLDARVTALVNALAVAIP